MQARPAVTIFDVDGTLLRTDSWSLFLKVALRTYPRLIPGYYGARLWAQLQRVFGLGRPGNVRAIGLTWVVAKLSADELAAVTDLFLDTALNQYLRPGAIDHLIQRRKAGDRIIFATAAFDFYVGGMAARLGGAEVVCSKTLVAANGRILPSLDGELCRGEDKLSRVKDLFSGGRRPPFVRAFGTRETDFPLLAWADAGTAVNPDPALADEAQALGLAVVDWSFGATDAPVRAPRMPVPTPAKPSEHSKQR